MLKKIREEFNEFAPTYDDVVINDLGYDAFIKIPTEMMAICPVKSGDSVLDLGCGTGLSSELFLAEHAEVHGVDAADEMIKIAKKKGFKSCRNFDLNQPNWPISGSYDFILGLGLMEFILEPESFLNSCKNLLQPTGLIGLTFPLNTFAEASVDVKSYDIQQVQLLLSECGFVIDEVVLFTGYEMDDEDVNYLGVIAHL